MGDWAWFPPRSPLPLSLSFGATARFPKRNTSSLLADQVSLQTRSRNQLRVAQEKEEGYYKETKNLTGRMRRQVARGLDPGTGSHGLSGGRSLSPPLLPGLHVLPAARLSVRLLHCLCGPVSLSAYSGLFGSSILSGACDSHPNPVPTLPLAQLPAPNWLSGPIPNGLAIG